MAVLDLRRRAAARHNCHEGGDTTAGRGPRTTAPCSARLRAVVVHLVHGGGGDDPSLAAKCRRDGDRNDGPSGCGEKCLDYRRCYRLAAPSLAADDRHSELPFGICRSGRCMVDDVDRVSDHSPATLRHDRIRTATRWGDPSRHRRAHCNQPACCCFDCLPARGRA